MAPSDIDAATEALIAQLMAEDLGESYHRHSAPIGASYHDYEEPLSSYERQCLHAENDPDDEGGEGCGWGPEYPDVVDGAAAPVGGLYSTELANESTWDSNDETWDSRFINEDGEVQDHTTSDYSPPAAGAGKDDHHSDSNACSAPTKEDFTSSPARVIPLPAYDGPTSHASEIRNSAPTTIPIQPTPDVLAMAGPLGPIRVPNDHLDPSPNSSHLETFIPSSHLATNERLPTPSEWEVEGPWDDGLDYSSSKGKGRAVRAYDEFKRGLRDGEKECWDPGVADPEHNREPDADDDSEEEEEGEIRDEDLPFFRVPWPCAEKDEVLTRRENAEVVEIRVGDDETLESILQDISVRDERRQGGKGVENRVESAGGG